LTFITIPAVFDIIPKILIYFLFHKFVHKYIDGINLKLNTILLNNGVLGFLEIKTLKYKSDRVETGKFEN
jgi:hypothetical protein